MPCYRPVTAFKPVDGGPIIFMEKKGYREIKIPCNGCIGCRIRKREEWATRIYCESKMHKESHFVTLTYDDSNLPVDFGLNYRDIQLFHKRMREAIGPFRFFVAGEYGDKNKRPHYHGVYFGLQLDDLVKCNSLYSASDLFTSERVGKCWGKGHHSIGEVTYASARYCATYAVKRIRGEAADLHYERVSQHGEIIKVEPEFAKMSLKPGIGVSWLEKYWRDIYSVHDKVVINGSMKNVPKAFDLQMGKIDAFLMEDVKFKREKEAESFIEHTTEARLAVREKCAKAREKLHKEQKVYDL